MKFHRRDNEWFYCKVEKARQLFTCATSLLNLPFAGLFANRKTSGEKYRLRYASIVKTSKIN